MGVQCPADAKIGTCRMWWGPGGVQVNANAPPGTIRGIAMLNCAAGMNNKVGLNRMLRIIDALSVSQSLCCYAAGRTPKAPDWWRPSNALLARVAPELGGHCSTSWAYPSSIPFLPIFHIPLFHPDHYLFSTLSSRSQLRRPCRHLPSGHPSCLRLLFRLGHLRIR